ncbi:alpha/beta hydrolase family protein [Luteimonas sp. A277]
MAAELGPHDVSGSPGCPVAGESLPLVVISHGHGGTLLGHHDTATALADAGFVVVSLNHPGDTFGDDSGAYRVAIFESRPRDVSRVLSFMLEEWPARGQLDHDAVGVFGFSRGGYTALALAGAKPNVTAAGQRLCSRWWSLIMPMCREIRFSAPELEPQADPRIRAAVVVDPLNLFDDAGLQSVRVPVQLWASELGGDGVEFEHIEAIRTALPQAPEYHVAKGAGHFAYLAPCAPRLAETAREICEDPEGFDRVAWHRAMNEAVVSFLKRHLSR